MSVLKQVKCVLLGDRAVGKMCFSQVVTTGVFPPEYIGVGLFDEFSHRVLVRNRVRNEASNVEIAINVIDVII